jgi:hypothetical protein
LQRQDSSKLRKRNPSPLSRETFWIALSLSKKRSENIDPARPSLQAPFTASQPWRASAQLERIVAAIQALFERYLHIIAALMNVLPSGRFLAAIDRARSASGSRSLFRRSKPLAKTAQASNHQRLRSVRESQLGHFRQLSPCICLCANCARAFVGCSGRRRPSAGPSAPLLGAQTLRLPRKCRSWRGGEARGAAKSVMLHTSAWQRSGHGFARGATARHRRHAGRRASFFAQMRILAHAHAIAECAVRVLRIERQKNDAR